MDFSSEKELYPDELVSELMVLNSIFIYSFF